MDDNTLIVMLVGIPVSAAIGAFCGSFKRNSLYGFLLGALIGPLGWIVVLLLPTKGPLCPSCKAAYNPGATRCCHCGSEIIRSPGPQPIRSETVKRAILEHQTIEKYKKWKQEHAVDQ